MLITDKRWSEIREYFDEEEKARLREARTGQMAHPAGNYIDLTKLPSELQEKLKKIVPK